MTDADEAALHPLDAPFGPLTATGREIELKFRISEAAFKAAQQWEAFTPGESRPRARRLLSVYFDTAEGDLARHKITLRVRAQNKRYVMACKWLGSFEGGVFERGEVEVVSILPEPELELFGAEIAGAITTITGGRALEATYTTDIKRMTRRIDTETSQIEVAFDVGIIKTEENSCHIREVEMELKAGETAALYNCGISFAKAFPVQIESLSKSERGASLRSGKPPSIVRAVSVLNGEPTVDEAISALINTCISQFIGNWPAFENGNGVKAVHQMRVAMRRLRSVLSLFRRSFRSAEFTAYSLHAKALAAAMGEARNWDVFIDLIQQGPLLAFPNEHGFEKILKQAHDCREIGYASIRTLLSAPDTTGFILTVQGFVARHGWRNALSGEALPRLTAPAKEFASANLGRLHRRLAKQSKNLTELTPYHRHELRKDLKKLRYTADLFGSLFEGRGHVNAYNRIVSDLQNGLGIFNDLIVAQQMASQLDTNSDMATGRAVGIVVGWCGRGAVSDDAVLNQTWKKFRKLKTFT